MIREIDITNPKIAEEVLTIQVPSYEVEAKLIDYYEIPPLKDTVETMQKCGETFFGYYFDGELCGAISIKAENRVIDIHRLIVHPNHFKKGIAKLLLDFVESRAGNISSITVSTGSKNTPAINFYKKYGFSVTAEKRITEQLFLTFFKKTLHRKSQLIFKNCGDRIKILEERKYEETDRNE